MGKVRVRRFVAAMVVVAVGVVSVDALGQIIGGVNTLTTPPRFYLTIGGQTSAFAGVKAIYSALDSMEYTYPEMPRGVEFIHPKQLGNKKPLYVVLEQSLTPGTAQRLIAWHAEGRTAGRQDALLTLSTAANPSAPGATVESYVLDSAWPSKLEVSGAKAGSTQIVTTVTIQAYAIYTAPSGQSSVPPSNTGSTGSTGASAAPATPHGPPSALNAVSCPSATACTAVGSEQIGGVYRPLVEQWNGTTWSSSVAPLPAGATGAILNGVSCVSSSACVAVGTWHDASGTFTLAESWDGTVWTVQTTQNIAGATTVLHGVSCTSSSACVAVGTASGPAQHFAISEVWDGTAWKPQPVPKPSPYGPYATSLASVSCTSASSCTAVGGNGSGPFAAQWNGTSWSLQTPLTPVGATAAALNAIACTPGGTCMAVGSSTSSTGTGALAESLAGLRWAIHTVPTPTNTKSPVLNGVWCFAASSCAAVGSIVNPTYGLKPLVESWSARAWHKVPSPNPAGEGNTAYDAVACATSCEAVGSSAKPTVTAVMQLLTTR